MTTTNEAGAGRPVHDPTEAPQEASQAADDALVMGMLHEHVPLSLLCDLTLDDEPHSAEILAEEGKPDDAWWEQ